MTRKTLTIFLSTGFLILPGCRFGNRVETVANTAGAARNNPQAAASPAAPVDRSVTKQTGFYRTAAKALTLCASPSSFDCQPVSVDKADAEVTGVMTDPVAVIFDVGDAGKGYLVNGFSTGDGLRTSVQADGTIGFEGQTKPVEFLPKELWPEGSQCTLQLVVRESGNLTRYGQYQTMPNFNYYISGTAQVTLQFYRLLDSVSEDKPCADSLKAVRACYDAPSLCGTKDDKLAEQRYQFVRQFYDPYLSAGAMAIDDLTSVSILAYEIVYQ